jgi:nucleotide-binding universal stress UspA family protein
MLILYASDGSAHAQAAGDLLAGWPLAGRARAVTLTVVPPVPLFSPELIAPASPGAAALPEIVARETIQAEQIAKSSGAPLATRGVEVEARVQHGSPTEEILKATAELRPDLIALGARGHSPLAELLIGSVSHSVAKHVRCSALVARDGGTVGRAVLLAVDGSPESEAATRFLAALPLPERQECCVLHVVERGEPASHEAGRVPAEGGWRAAERLLEEPIAVLSGAGYPAQGLVRRGHAAQEILRAAKELSAGLIVVGDRGKSGIREFLLGSVSGLILRYAPCSVLIARGAG